jgi:pyrophosphatase PpaX
MTGGSPHLTAQASRRPFAVLFDLDGTLIDSIGLILASMEFAFEGRERRPATEEWVAAIGTPLDGMLRRWARDEEDVLALRARYREFTLLNHDAMTTAYPGAIETVRALHAEGHPLAIVTSKLEVGARRSLSYLGIEDCFAAVIGLDATTKHKPDPEPVRFALSRLGGIAPSGALFVGDSVHDMRSGNAAGVATAAALWGPSRREELAAAAPTHWLRDFPELHALVRRLASRAARG